MWNIRAAVLSSVVTIAFALNLYGSDSGFRAQSVLASLVFLEKQTGVENYSPDQVRNIEAHFSNINQYIAGGEFKPLIVKKMLDGKGGTWHRIPWLDDDCWAKETLCYLNCDFEPRYDYGCNNPGEGRWCTAGLATCCIWPSMSIVLATLAGMAQVLVCTGSIPYRFDEEIIEEPNVSALMLQSFIRDKAIQLKAKVKDQGIQLAPGEQGDLERLSSY